MKWLCVLTGLGVLGQLAAQAGAGEDKDKLWVFVGTYTGAKSKGIYRFEFDRASGKAGTPELVAATQNPSFLTVHPSLKYLYAVAEISGNKGGAINAYRLDAKTGELSFLNQQPAGGNGPCHIVVDKTGKCALAANYGGGSACALPIQDDGKLGPPNVVQHKGKSVDAKRQQGPHAHSINLDAANRFAFVADLGLDKVLIYKFDADKATLTPNDPPAADVEPGAGPRHFAFHPSGRHAYVINELNNTITVFDYDAERGALKTRRVVTTLPKDFKGTSYTAEVVVHPSGKFVYGSNRGHNSIAIFKVDAKTGELTAAGHQTGVNWPRNFAVDPGGAYLLAGSERGHRILVFRINADSGALTPTETTIDVAAPVCIRMIPQGR